MNTKVYDHSFNVLRSVLKEHLSFSVAVKNNSRGVSKDEFSGMSALAGIFLRNYFSIKVIAEAVFNATQEEPVIYIGLVYVNNLYKKYVDEKESLTYLVNKLSLYQVKFDDTIKENFKKAIEDKNAFLKEIINSKKISKTPRTYLSCITNLPEWIIKMLHTQYGRDYGLDTIHAIFKMPRQYAVLNKILGEVKEEELSEFKLIEPELYEYKSKTSIRKDVLVRESKLMPIQKAEFDMVKSLPDGENLAVTFYFEEKNSIYVSIINKYLNGTNKVSLASNNPRLNPDLYSKIKPLKKEKLDIYESTETELIAHLSEKQDIFVLLPKSSNLEMLRRTPEYGIIFDEKTLDGLIENELNELVDVTQYLSDNGKLVYCVPTFDIKETMLIVHKFLEMKKDFKLVKECTYFPFEKDNSVFYYAVFEKKDN